MRRSSLRAQLAEAAYERIYPPVLVKCNMGKLPRLLTVYTQVAYNVGYDIQTYNFSRVLHMRGLFSYRM